MFSGVFMRVFASVILLGMASVEGAPAPAPDSEAEDDLKAAIVLSFLRYTDWPPSVGSVITVGIYGKSSIAEVLRRTLHTKAIGNRTVKLVELKDMPGADCCQVIYFASENRSELREALVASQRARVLTIGHAKAFLELGGAINILSIDGHMSFEVSLEMMERTGLTISSKLLRFGQIRGSRKADRS